MTVRATDQAAATVIKNETTTGANTATRVGANLLAITTDALYIEDLSAIAPPALGVAAVGTSGSPARADHVHVMPRLDQVSAPTAAVAMNAQALTGLLDPVNPQDGSTKNYSDTKINHFGNWGQLGSNAATAVRFLDFGNVRDATHATEESSAQVMSVSGTVTKLLVSHFSALTTDTVTYTLRVNSVDTALTCTVAANATAASDLAHTASFAIGDRLSIKSVQSSTQSNAALGASVSLGYKSP